MSQHNAWLSSGKLLCKKKVLFEETTEVLQYIKKTVPAHPSFPVPIVCIEMAQYKSEFKAGQTADSHFLPSSVFVYCCCFFPKAFVLTKRLISRNHQYFSDTERIEKRNMQSKIISGWIARKTHRKCCVVFFVHILCGLLCPTLQYIPSPIFRMRTTVLFPVFFPDPFRFFSGPCIVQEKLKKNKWPKI